MILDFDQAILGISHYTQRLVFCLDENKTEVVRQSELKSSLVQLQKNILDKRL